MFETFLQCRSASKVVEVFNTHDLLLPRRNRFGDLVWKAPRVAAVLAILKHPAYAGAFTYGRSRTLRREATQARPSITRLPQEQWRICIPDVYPPSISWETYLQFRPCSKTITPSMTGTNPRDPRPGKALLHGLVYCGECGHKMVVQYKGAPATSVTTSANSIGPCVSIYCGRSGRYPGRGCVFQALSPVEPMSMNKPWPSGSSRPSASPPPTRSIARLRYEAAYCERQFHHVDPAHRHVAAELEHAWELALQALKQAEAAEQQRAQASTPPAHAPPPALQAATAPLASTSRNSGPLTCCRRHSARPCCVVSSTRW